MFISVGYLQTRNQRNKALFFCFLVKAFGFEPPTSIISRWSLELGMNSNLHICHHMTQSLSRLDMHLYLLHVHVRHNFIRRPPWQTCSCTKHTRMPVRLHMRARISVVSILFRADTENIRSITTAFQLYYRWHCTNMKLSLDRGHTYTDNCVY